MKEENVVDTLMGMFNKDPRPEKGDSWQISLAKMEALIAKKERVKK